MDPDEFPLLRAGARSPARLDAALNTIAAAVQAGEIRNVVLQGAKATLSNAVQDAWTRHINDRHFTGEVWRDGSMSPELQDLYYKVNVYGLHDVHAAVKRIGATKVEGPAVDAMRALLSELLPLAQAVSGLKDKVIKGRAPVEPRPPTNPDQLRMTCGCCTRPIAVMGGTPKGRMAHHGYERPGQGWQTASCPGIKFMPLETTDDGPRYMLDLYEARLRQVQDALARAPNLTKLPVLVRERGVKVLKEITPDMQEWRRVYDAHVHELERERGSLAYAIPQVRKIIDEWRPVTDAAKEVLMERHGEIPARYRADPAADDPLVEVDAEDDGHEERAGERMTG
jgi:hypothetical protein